MKHLLAISLLLLAGCMTPRHQQGGASTVILPQMEPASVTIMQPENPEGASGMVWREVVTVTDPATGYVTVTERNVDTTVGGAQDLAKIIKEAMAGQYLKKLIAVLFLVIAAAVALYKEWPIVASILAGAAFATIFLPWWVVGTAMAAAGGIYFGYRAAPTIP